MTHPLPWFKMFADIGDHPKLLRITPQARWRYIQGLCYLGEHRKLGDKLPAVFVQATSRKALAELAYGDDAYGPLWHLNGDGGAHVNDWNEMQAPADPTAAERMRRYRERKAQDAA